MSYRFLLLGLSLASCLGVACSSDTKNEGPIVTTGGQPGTGGDATGSGGSASGGESSTGGAESGGGSPSSGGTPTATGGASSGGSTTTTGGASATTGGAAATDGGSETDAGFTPNPGTVDVVVCKEDGTACTESENCCYTRAVTFPTQTPATYTCSDKPCTGGDIAISCDGREDCHGGQSCCRVDVVGGGTSYSCRDKCNSTVIGCSGAVNCPAGRVCCGRQNQLLGTAMETECSATCTGTGSYIMCTKKSDCPANAPNCVGSSSMPGLRYCQ